MSGKHLNILWVIVALAMVTMPLGAWAKGSGVLLERAQVSSVEDGEVLQIDLTLRNQLSVHVRAIELGLECKGEPKFEKMGRRAMGLEPGKSVSAFWRLAGPQVKPQDCSVRLLGYALQQPTQDVIKLLLRTGYSADERAALLSTSEKTTAVDWKEWAQLKPTPTPSVHEVLERLLSWFALSRDPQIAANTLPDVEGLERFDQSLQIVLAARAKGTRFSSPIAFLLPDGVSTMKDAMDAFQKRTFSPVAALSDFQTQPLTSNQPVEPAETSHFYRNLSLVLLTGIVIWALWGFRKKSRVGVK